MLILASASPRRSQLLSDLGVPFVVQPSGAYEPPPDENEGFNPGDYVEKLARLKAQTCNGQGLILAADTVVVLENAILNKPADAEEALQMLQRLRGQTHRVFTGLCLKNGDQMRCEHEITRVTFGEASDDFLRAYIATGEPLDKAGAYGAQGRGALLIERIEGDYWNVVGLPLFRLARMLDEFGFTIQNAWTQTENCAR